MFQKISLSIFIVIFLSTNVFAQMSSTLFTLEKHMNYIKALNKQYNSSKIEKDFFHKESNRNFRIVREKLELILEKNNELEIKRLIDLFEKKDSIYPYLLHLPRIKNLFEDYKKGNYFYNDDNYNQISNLLKKSNKTAGCGILIYTLVAVTMIGAVYWVDHVASDGTTTPQGEVTLSLNECYYCGGSKMKTCPNCEGLGYDQWNNNEVCDWCYGDGKIICNNCEGTGKEKPEEYFTTPGSCER